MSPRTPEQNEEIRQQRIRQILEAAREVYIEKGFLSTEIGEIAKKAGIARGLVYYYYKDKYELFQTLFEGALTAAIQFVSARLKTTEPPLERLQQYALHYLHTAAQDPSMVHFFRDLYQDIPAVFGERGDEISKNFTTNIHQPLADTFADAMEQGLIRIGDPYLFSQIFWGGISGAMFTMTGSGRSPESAETNAYIQQTIDVLFNGLLI
ncbi:TetR/AcrR family transcriptional regulator [Neobacillus ginsengisoli]|uniref:AcrR family transcriptional regulator n=1 Tax=Neobacillus ginsengisoli TaxID=904295 RepID=A0ABT9XR27_9BACI|nr:TetR/AcrR family transcriptional regulator [Neobacillus ginsengisoli]MDQ0197414.1 AcrR family transcriptional regulator [Neobacillus ginsengisoli]